MTKERCFVIPAQAGIRWRSNIRHSRAGGNPLEECKQILASARMTKKGCENDEGKAFRHVRVGEHPLEECKQILAFARMTKKGCEDDEGRKRE